MALLLQADGKAAVSVPICDLSTLNFAARQGDRISAQGIAALGLIGFLLAWLAITLFKIHSIGLIVTGFMALTGLPMVIGSIVGNSTYARPSTGLAVRRHFANWSRIRIKLIGLFGTFATLWILYSFIPEYNRAFYRPVWDIIVLLSLPVVCLSLPYTMWIDNRMKEPEDGYFHAGLLFLGRWNEINEAELRLYGLSWLVKGFFLPFMLAGAADRLNVLNREGINFSSFGYLYASGVNLTYTIDVVFGAIGYLMTLRILDAQIQSVESTILGWLCTICCYVPFSTLIWTYVLNYKGKTNWYDWLAHYPVVCITWGFAIMILHVIYVWSTCSFGCRFSNLTNRGIITHGPYRYLKHPAYLSKNIAWWLMSVPFVAHHTFWDAFRACICLLITNFIYGLRAWTEERHLLHDPAYQVYSAWIEEHGLGSQFRSLWKKKIAKQTVATN